MQNPGEESAHVNLDYYCSDGENVHRELDLGPHSRFTVPVHSQDPGIGACDSFQGDVSIKVTSSQKIVAERPMYFNYGPGDHEWQGGGVVMGCSW